MLSKCARKDARETRLVIGWAALVALALAGSAVGAGRQAFENFVRREGDVL
jgi:hypothetical protein